MAAIDSFTVAVKQPDPNAPEFAGIRADLRRCTEASPRPRLRARQRRVARCAHERHHGDVVVLVEARAGS